MHIYNCTSVWWIFKIGNWSLIPEFALHNHCQGQRYLVSAPQYVSQRTISTATQHNILPVRHSCHVPATSCELWTSSVYLCTAWHNSFSHHAAPATYVEDIPWLSSVSCEHIQYIQQTKPLKAECNTYKWTFTSMQQVFPHNSNCVHFLTQRTSKLHEDSQLPRCNAVPFTFQPLKMKALHSFKLPGNTNPSTYCHIPEHLNCQENYSGNLKSCEL
jgi:hypothetical protein